MTDRIPLDDLTSDQLDQLYNDLEEARAEQKRFRTMYDASESRVNDLIDERDKLDRKLTTMTDVARGNLKHVQSIVPDLEAATQRAERAEGERGDLLVKLASVREDRDRWRDQARTEQADRRTAEEESRRARQAEAEQRARAERAEAAIERVRAVADEWAKTAQRYPDSRLTTSAVVVVLRTALDEQQEQPTAVEREPVCTCTWAGLEIRRCPVHEPTT